MDKNLPTFTAPNEFCFVSTVTTPHTLMKMAFQGRGRKRVLTVAQHPCCTAGLAETLLTLVALGPEGDFQ